MSRVSVVTFLVMILSVPFLSGCAIPPNIAPQAAVHQPGAVVVATARGRYGLGGTATIMLRFTADGVVECRIKPLVDANGIPALAAVRWEDLGDTVGEGRGRPGEPFALTLTSGGMAWFTPAPGGYTALIQRPPYVNWSLTLSLDKNPDGS